MTITNGWQITLPRITNYLTCISREQFRNPAIKTITIAVIDMSLVKIQSSGMDSEFDLHYAPGAAKSIGPHKQRSIACKRVKPLIKLLVLDGIQLTEILRGTGITHQDILDPDGRIRLSQYQLLIRNAYQYSKDNSFAARLGEQFHLNNDGLLAYRVMSSQNVRQALQLLTSYQPLLTDMLDLSFAEHDQEAEFSIEPAQELGATLPYFIEYLFSIINATGKFCLGMDQLPLRFEFSYPRESGGHYYCRYFSSDLVFNQAYYRAVLPKWLLDKPLIFRNEDLAQRIDRDCQSQVRSISEGESFASRVREQIRKQGVENTSLDSIASTFCLAPRSLRRQLAMEGLSFKSLLDAERKYLAMRAVKSRKDSLELIALELGYKDASSFSRAFKRWFGASPNHFRGKRTT